MFNPPGIEREIFSIFSVISAFVLSLVPKPTCRYWICQQILFSSFKMFSLFVYFLVDRPCNYTATFHVSIMFICRCPSKSDVLWLKFETCDMKFKLTSNKYHRIEKRISWFSRIEPVQHSLLLSFSSIYFEQLNKIQLWLTVSLTAWERFSPSYNIQCNRNCWE